MRALDDARESVPRVLTSEVREPVLATRRSCTAVADGLATIVRTAYAYNVSYRGAGLQELDHFA